MREFQKAREYLADCQQPAEFWDTDEGQTILQHRSEMDALYQRVLLKG